LKVGKALGATIEVIAIVIMVLGTAYFFKQQTGIVKGMTTGRGYEVYAMLIMSLAVSLAQSMVFYRISDLLQALTVCSCLLLSLDYS